MHNNVNIARQIVYRKKHALIAPGAKSGAKGEILKKPLALSENLGIMVSIGMESISTGFGDHLVA